MNLKAVFIYIGHILRIEGALMLPALVLALANGERNAALGFGAAMRSACSRAFCWRV